MNLRQALILYLAAKGDRPGKEGDLVWSTTMADYYFAATGRPVSGGRVQDAWDAYLQDVQNDIGRFTESLLNGRTSVNAWHRQMRDHLSDVMRIGYMTGRGGYPQMNPADWGRVGHEVQRQNRYLERFAGQLATAQAGTEGQVMNRAQMYGRSARKMYAAGRRVAKDVAGYNKERRSCIGDKGTCGECARLAGLGWQPLGTLPLPGEGTPCMSNCRCSVFHGGGDPILQDEELAMLMAKIQEEYYGPGQFSGFTYDTLRNRLDDEGFSVSIHKEREDRWPVESLSARFLTEYAEANADLLNDRSKFPYRFGGWTSAGDLWLDVSMVIPRDQIIRAAEYVVKYNQEAMFSIHELEEYNRKRCIQLLVDAGKLSPNYVDPMIGEAWKSMHQQRKEVKLTGDRKPLFFVTAQLPGAKDPETGRRYTAEDYMGQIYDLAQFLHLHHGAKTMTPRDRLETIVEYYASHDGVDPELFWEARPHLKPKDWDEQKEVYLYGHPVNKAKLAWDEGLDLD